LLNAWVDQLNTPRKKDRKATDGARGVGMRRSRVAHIMPEKGCPICVCLVVAINFLSRRFTLMIAALK
jgi:hypothetical protein